jgi:hypothetical protein
MALTVDFVGRRITDAEAITDFVTARVDGGGGQSWGSIAVNANENIQGTNCVSAESTANSNSKVVFFGYDYLNASGANLDFTIGGTEEGQMVWVWAKMIAPQPTGSYATLPGLSIGLSSAGAGTPDDTNTAWWTFYGIENYPGSWVRMVVDPLSSLPTASGASFTLASVSHVGMVGTTQTAKGSVEVAFLDAIDIGSGINVYGSTDTVDGFLDLFNESESSSNKYGIIGSLENTNTVFSLQGQLNLGDIEGTNNLAFTGQDSVLAFAAPKYQANADGALVNALDDDFQNFSIQGNTGVSSTTNVTFGIKVDGATTDEDTGRNGIIFLGNDDYNIDFRFNAGNVDSLDMYGCTIRNFQPTGGLVWNAASNHDFVGSFLDNSAKLTPDSGVRIRNSTFLNHPSGIGPTGEADAAVLFETSPPDTEISDIVNSSFVSNFYAVEHAESGEYTYDGLSFSANDYDVYYSYTGVGDLTINATNGSNPTTAETGNPSNTVTFVNAVTLTLEDVVANSEVRFYTSGTKTERYGVENSPNDGDGFGDVAFSYQFGDPGVDIRIFHLDYQPLNLFARTLGSTNASIPIQQIPDRNYENP